MRKCFLLAVLLIVLAGCGKDDTSIAVVNDFTQKYSTYGSKIYNYDKPVQLIGANTFHVFGGDARDLAAWKLNLAREFVGNVKENPISGAAIKDSNGSYLHSLQTIADDNRKNSLVTIFAAFGWDGKASTEYTGKSPSQTSWLNDYRIKLKQWAIQFKEQPDVWIEVWNEPYRYDRSDGFTNSQWLSDMNDLVTVIRSAGNNNLILIPCAEQGQDESVLISEGANFLKDKKNILFDIHAYEKWLLVNNEQIGTRLVKIKQNNLPIIFGEVGPMNAGVLMNPSAFLDMAYNNGHSISAWLWKYDETDKDALLDASGKPNNVQNNNWGSLYKDLCERIRNP